MDYFCRENFNVKKDVYYCVNTHDSTDNDIGHWILVKLGPRSVVVFDSYGQPLTLYNDMFEIFFKKIKRLKKIVYNVSMALQAYDSLICGLYVVLAAKILATKGVKKFKTFVRKILRGKNRQKNDRAVIKHFYKDKNDTHAPSCLNTFCDVRNDECESLCEYADSL